MSKSDKPFYVNPTGPTGPDDLPSCPPFAFEGVTCRIFPLEANISRLTSFCDDYLNMDIPDEIVHYFPAVPYVYLAVLHYGEMSPLLFSAKHVGWVSQDEVFFMIPLQVWKKVGTRMVFQEWAWVSPFIFVNDPLSMTTGREVYGWAKILGEIIDDKSSWLTNPAAPTRVFGLRAPVFAKEYEGEEEENRLLLEINRSAPPSLLNFPPDLASLAGAIPDVAKAWLGLAGNAFDMATALPIRGYRNTRSLRSSLDMAKTALKGAMRVIPNPLRNRLIEKNSDNALGYGRIAQVYVNQITLKQFRAAGHPNQACYQAVVSSRMSLDRLNRCGLLGDLRALLGDPSGGYSIRLHQYDAYPIVDSLGLTVHKWERSEQGQVAVLKPVFPLWTDVDMNYDVGKTVCYRYRGKVSDGKPSHWHTDSGEVRPASSKDDDDRPENGIPYNATRGGSSQAVVGPYHYPDVTLQVYPLLASRVKLQEFVDNYLDKTLNPESAPSGLNFEPFGEYVYLVVESVGHDEGVMWSETNNIGCWADKSVSFCVPVKIYKDGKFHGVALSAPYGFANNNRAVISDREINGRVSVMSTITGQVDLWPEDSVPVKPRKMLELSTEILPALGVGAESENCSLIQIGENLPQRLSSGHDWRLTGEGWREPLLAELRRKTDFWRDHEPLARQAQALALQILASNRPIDWINIKQYRDSEFSERACYQSLVKVSRTIDRVMDLREIEARLFVRITYAPEFPIVDTLGLKVMNVLSNDRVEQILQPIRPFWMRVGLSEDLGDTLAWRVNESEWNLTRALTEEKDRGGPRVGMGVLDALLKNGKQHLQQKAARWLATKLKSEALTLQNVLIEFSEKERRDLLKKLEQRMSRPDLFSGSALEMAVTAVKLSAETDAQERLKKTFLAFSSDGLHEVVEILAGPMGEVIGSVPVSVEDGNSRRDKAFKGFQREFKDFRRFSVEDERMIVEGLDDAQIVIEPILSEQWEYGGEPRDSGSKPHFCLYRDRVDRDWLFGGMGYERKDLTNFEKGDKGALEGLEDLRVWEKSWVYIESNEPQAQQEPHSTPKME